MSIIPFSFEGAAVRVIEIVGAPWFVASDVCQVLEHTNPSVALSRLDDDEKGVSSVYTPGGPQDMAIINESGLYSLILTSRKLTAKRLKKWVTAEVLPTIRKTGGYGAGPVQIDVRDPSQLSRIAIQLIEVNKELEQRAATAERAVEAAKPKTEFYDQFVNADGLYGLQNAARVLRQNPNKFIQVLKQKYLFYQGSELVPYIRYAQMGLFEVKATIIDEKSRKRTWMTPKGLQYFAGKLGVDQGNLDIHEQGTEP
jgi:anti-repressor protein